MQGEAWAEQCQADVAALLQALHSLPLPADVLGPRLTHLQALYDSLAASRSLPAPPAPANGFKTTPQKHHTPESHPHEAEAGAGNASSAAAPSVPKPLFPEQPQAAHLGHTPTNPEAQQSSHPSQQPHPHGNSRVTAHDPSLHQLQRSQDPTEDTGTTPAQQDQDNPSRSASPALLWGGSPDGSASPQGPSRQLPPDQAGPARPPRLPTLASDLSTVSTEGSFAEGEEGPREAPRELHSSMSSQALEAGLAFSPPLFALSSRAPSTSAPEDPEGHSPGVELPSPSPQEASGPSPDLSDKAGGELPAAGLSRGQAEQVAGASGPSSQASSLAGDAGHDLMQDAVPAMTAGKPPLAPAASAGVPLGNDHAAQAQHKQVRQELGQQSPALHADGLGDASPMQQSSERTGEGDAIDLSALTAPDLPAAQQADSRQQQKSAGRQQAVRHMSTARHTAEELPRTERAWLTDPKAIFARVQQLRTARRTQN